MSKITLTNLVDLQNETTAVGAINSNNGVLTTALDNTLSRDGTTPNTMSASLDMNSNRIINLPLAISNFEPLRLVDVTTLGSGGTITVNPLPVGGTINQVLSKNSSTNFDASWKTISFQPLEATLTALAAISGTTGFLTQTAVDTFTQRTIIGPANGISVTNGSGVAGNPTLALTNDLLGVEGLATTGIVRRTSTDTWTAGTLISLNEGGTGSSSFTGIVGEKSNTNIIGGTTAGGSLTSSTANVLIGLNAGRFITSGTGENVCIGSTSGQTMTTGTQNTIVGAEAGASMTSDTGHTLVGYQAGLSLNGAAQTWNTFIGHAAGNLATGAGGCTAIGRAAGRGFLNDTDCQAIGHASFFYNNGGVCTAVTAIGNQAAGAPVDGTGTNWQGSGLTYYGPINDTNVMFMGNYTGKTSTAARANCSAFGNLARIPLLDNVIVLGHGVTAVETAGRVWEGATSVTINNNAGVTWTAAQMLTGIINRTGAPGAGFNETTATAAQIVAAGPGQSCEVPCSMDMVYINNGTTQLATVVAGTGVTLAGIGTGMSNNATVRWKIIVTNSTAASEAVTFYRVS